MADTVDAPTSLPAWLDASAFNAPGGRMPTPPPPEPIAPTARARRAPTTPAPDIKQFAKDYPEQSHLLAKLVPIAQSLAAAAGSHGIIVADVRKAAVAKGLLTGFEKDRALSFLAHLGRAAGLVQKSGVFRKSDFDKARSHGNQQQVWIAPEFAPR